MRRPIAVQVEQFEIDQIQSRIDQVRTDFGYYLATIVPKSSRSKHGLMGPIGKILNEVRSGRLDAASLKGYALRVQEQSAVRAELSAIQHLEAGIVGLVELVSGVPLSFRDKVIDRLDYGLYFDLRKRMLERREVFVDHWRKFLSEKYAGISDLNQSWKEVHKSFEDVPIQKKAVGSRSANSTQKQNDVFEFWESVGKEKEVLVSEEE